MSSLVLPDDVPYHTLFKARFIDVCNACDANKESHNTICNNRFWYHYGVYNRYIDTSYDSNINYKHYIFRNYIMEPIVLRYHPDRHRSIDGVNIPAELTRFLTMSLMEKPTRYTPDGNRFLDIYRCNKLYVPHHVSRPYFYRNDNCEDINVDDHRIRIDIYKMMYNDNIPFYIVFFLVVGKYQQRKVNRLSAVKIYIPGRVSDDTREAIDTFFRNNLPKILKHQYPALQQPPRHFW